MKLKNLKFRNTGADKLWDVIANTNIIEWGGGTSAREIEEPYSIPKLIFRPHSKYEHLADKVIELIEEYEGELKWCVLKRKRQLWGYNYIVYPKAALNLAEKHGLRFGEDNLPTKDSFNKLEELEQEFCIEADKDLENCVYYLEKIIKKENLIAEK